MESHLVAPSQLLAEGKIGRCSLLLGSLLSENRYWKDSLGET